MAVSARKILGLEPQEQPIEKVALLPIRQRKVLMARNKGEKLFCNFEGQVEPGEAAVVALARECMEGGGIRLLIETCDLLNEFNEREPSGRRLTLNAYTGEYDGDLLPGNKIEEFRWCTSLDGDLMIERARHTLDWLAKEKIID